MNSRKESIVLCESVLELLEASLKNKDEEKRKQGRVELQKLGGVVTLANCVLFLPAKNRNGERALCELIKNIFMQFQGGVDMLLPKLAETCLSYAINQANVLGVERFLAMGADPNFQLPNGNTTLFYACMTTNKNPAIVTALLDHGADPNKPNVDGNFPLINIAGMENDTGIPRIKVLLKNKKTNINIRHSVNGLSPLYKAAISDNPVVLQELIDAHADIEIVTDRNETALHAATYVISVKCAKILLKAGANPNALCLLKTDTCDRSPESGLYQLIFKFTSHSDQSTRSKLIILIKSFLAYGADPFQICHENVSPFALAIGIFYMEALDAILQIAKLDLNRACDSDGRTPFLFACQHNNKQAIDKLFARNPNIEAMANDRYMAIHYAALNGNLNLIKRVCTPKTVNARCADNDFTPLILASQAGHLDIVKYLLSQGADATLSTQDGSNALLASIFNGHKNVAKFLIPLSPINHQSRDGATAIFLAAQQGHLDIVTDLCLAGGDPKINRHDEQTPLFIAYLEGHNQVMQYLLCQHYFGSMLNDFMQIEFELINQIFIDETHAQLSFKAKFTSTLFTPNSSLQPSKEIASNESENVTDADLQSTFDFLSDNGFPSTDIESIKDKWLKKTKTKSTATPTSTSSNNIECTWLNGALSVDKNKDELRVIESDYNGKPCYLYLSKKMLLQQGCDILDKIETSRCRFAARNHASGILKLRGAPIKAEVTIGNTTFEKNLTDEIKVEGKARVLCLRLPSDDNKSTLFIGCVFAPNGLHQTSDRSRLNTKITLDLPQPAPRP